MSIGRRKLSGPRVISIRGDEKRGLLKLRSRRMLNARFGASEHQRKQRKTNKR
jgi:hypothetical protein